MGSCLVVMVLCVLRGKFAVCLLQKVVYLAGELIVQYVLVVLKSQHR